MKYAFLLLLAPFVAHSQGSTPLRVTLNVTNFTTANPFFMGQVAHYYDSGRLVMSGGNGTLNENYSIRTYTPDCDEKVTITMEYKMLQSGAGIAISRVPMVHPEWMEKYSAIANHQIGKVVLNNHEGSSITNAVGNSFRLTISQFNYKHSATLTNLTTNETSSVEYEVGGVTSFIGIAPLGGKYAVSSFKVDRQSLKFADIICLGDSKTKGSSIVERYPSLLTNTGRTVEVWAGGGDRTVELVYSIPLIVAAQPKTVIICMGRNDLQGIPQATWKANYINAVAQLKTANIQVIHLLPIPETVIDQSPLKSFITSTFPNDITVDPSIGWDHSSMLTQDNIHQNATGNVHIASTIMTALGGTILPVDFTSFSAVCTGFTNLKWSTAQEINVKSFSVEKSENGSQWHQIGSLLTGSGQYLFKDNGSGFYRIAAIDHDGKKIYSKVVKSNCGTGNSIKIFPAITKDYVNVSVTVDKAEKMVMKIISSGGNMVKTLVRNTTAGNNQFKVEVYDLLPGMYFLEINGVVHKFIKN